jgi:hypothetical protein
MGFVVFCLVVAVIVLGWHVRDLHREVAALRWHLDRKV